MNIALTRELENHPVITGPYRVSYKYYYKNPKSDLSNVGPMASKWLLDVAQSLGIIQQDSVEFLVEETYTVAGQDRENPRIEADITPVKDTNVRTSKNGT